MATMETRADVLERSAALTRVSLTLCRHAVRLTDVARALGADAAAIRRVKRVPWISRGAGQPREGTRKATIQLHVECFYIWDQERQALTS